MGQRPSPRWRRLSERTVDTQVEEFNDNLRRIALQLARHQKSDNVDSKHVEEAFAALSRLGLKLRPWYSRPQFPITVAGICLGVAAGFPDFVPVFVADADWQFWTIVCGAFSFAVLSVALYVFGWLMDRL